MNMMFLSHEDKYSLSFLAIFFYRFFSTTSWNYIPVFNKIQSIFTRFDAWQWQSPKHINNISVLAKVKVFMLKMYIRLIRNR